MRWVEVSAARDIEWAAQRPTSVHTIKALQRRRVRLRDECLGSVVEYLLAFMAVIVHGIVLLACFTALLAAGAVQVVRVVLRGGAQLD